MTTTKKDLISIALNELDQAQTEVDDDFSDKLAQQSIACALIAIAQELHKINERAELEIEHQELIQAQKDRQNDI